MWKWPPYADGLALTGATMAPKWRGAAQKAPMPMLGIPLSLTV